MDSSDYGEFSEALERQAEEVANEAARNVAVRELGKLVGKAFIIVIAVLIRFTLAVIALFMIGGMLAVIMATVLLVWFGYLAWTVVRARRKAAKARAAAISEPISHADYEQANRQIDEYLAKNRPYRRPSQVLGALGQVAVSVLAGVGVGLMTDIAIGTLVGLALTAVAVAGPFLNITSVTRVLRLAQLQQPGPKNTPEI